jgi:hypothetical protein
VRAGSEDVEGTAAEVAAALFSHGSDEETMLLPLVVDAFDSALNNERSALAEGNDVSGDVEDRRGFVLVVGKEVAEGTLRGVVENATERRLTSSIITDTASFTSPFTFAKTTNIENEETETNKWMFGDSTKEFGLFASDCWKRSTLRMRWVRWLSRDVPI